MQYRGLGEGAQRYWTERGSRPTLYNADILLEARAARARGKRPADDYLLIVEGAKKAAALWSYGVQSVVGLWNKSGWKAEYTPFVAAFDRVCFVHDPDAEGEAMAAARTVPGAYVATLPLKPDDFLVATKGNVDALWRYVVTARRVG